MSELQAFAAVELDLQRLRQAVERAGEAFAAAFEDGQEVEAKEPAAAIDAPPDMKRYAAILGVASIALLSL
jgi:hypothetical protein